jgi:hypothetical protein
VREASAEVLFDSVTLGGLEGVDEIDGPEEDGGDDLVGWLTPQPPTTSAKTTAMAGQTHRLGIRLTARGPPTFLASDVQRIRPCLR